MRCNETLPLGAHALSPIQCQPSCILGNTEWFCVRLIIMLLTENLSAANQMLDALLKKKHGSGSLKFVHESWMNPLDYSSR